MKNSKYFYIYFSKFFRIVLLISLSLFLNILVYVGIAKSDIDELTRLQEKGIELFQSGDTKTALQFMEKGLKLSKQMNHEQAIAIMHQLIGVVFSTTGQYQSALEHNLSSMNMYRKIGETQGECWVLVGIGENYDNLGLHAKALVHLEQSLQISRKHGLRECEGSSLSTIGSSYLKTGQYQEALAYSEKALVISKEISDRQLEYMIYNNMGLIFRHTSEYQKALQYLYYSLAIVKTFDDFANEAATIGNIGEIYRILGNYEKAYDYSRKAYKIFQKIGSVSGVASALLNLSSIHFSTGQYQLALEIYEESLILSRKIEDRISEALALMNIANVYVRLGQSKKALEIYEQSLVIFKGIGNHNFESMALANIGAVLTTTGSYKDSLDYSQQALSMNVDVGNRFAEGTILNNMGVANRAIGRFSQAEPLLIQAMDVFETLRVGMLTDQDRGGFQSTLPGVYHNLAATRLALNNPGGAFEALERGRAKAFMDLLATRSVGRGEARQASEKLLELQARLDRARENRVQVASMSGPAGAKTRAAEMDKTISDLDRQRFRLIEEISRLNPELGDLVIVDAPSLIEIQGRLDNDAIIVAYAHSGKLVVDGKEVNQLWIFVVSDTGLRHVSVDVSKNELEQALNDYAALLAEPGSDKARLASLSSKLSSWTLAPISRDIQVAKNIILVPWGPMFKVPLAALPLENGLPLMAGHNVVTAPSAGVYRYIVEKRNSGRNSVFALGNPRTALAPLPAAEREAAEIAALFPKSKVVTRDNATETLVKTGVSGLGNPDVIHFASHGIFNEAAPQLSHLALTPDQHNDGNLEMHEVYGLDLQGVSLVVMSACSSGRGKLGAGDDLIGLTRGFMFAGAPSVLSSLWDVDDEATRELMVGFYKNYLSGMPKPEALRQAQLSMMQTPKWSHPNYWAGFVMFGDWM